MSRTYHGDMTTRPDRRDPAAAVAVWLGVTCYALFGGADFGGGFWDLAAGGAQRGQPRRAS